MPICMMFVSTLLYVSLANVFVAFSNYLISYLDQLVTMTTPDIVPLLSDPFISSFEKAALYFLRFGAMTHLLGTAPYSFSSFNRAIALMEVLFGKSINHKRL